MLKEKNSKIRWSLGFLLVSLMVFSCKSEPEKYTSFVLPDTGMQLSDDSFTAKLQFGTGIAPDSVVYLLDSVPVKATRDTSTVTISVEGKPVGNHILTAKVYANGSVEEVSTNIVVLAKNAPQEYGFTLIESFPHDTDSYVEGLEYHDGFIYESSGLEEQPFKIRKVALKTGKIVQKVDEGTGYFGEGITLVGNKIVQLTYRSNVGYVYDKSSFKKIGQFPYPSDREGWGLSFDGKKILNSSGSNIIHYLDKDTYQTIGQLEVYDNKGPVDQLNELEYIDGKIFANIYRTDGPYANKILIISATTGAVEGTINLLSIHPEKGNEYNPEYILNGIAWDKVGKRMFVTGKKWSRLFEIKPVFK